TRVTVAMAEPLIVPRLQTMVLVPLHVPWLGVTETKLVPLGSASVTDTPVAPPGPLFVTVMVEVKLPPTIAGSGEPVTAMPRSAACPDGPAIRSQQVPRP